MTASKRLLATLFILVGIVAGGYAAAPVLLTAVAVHKLGGVFEVRKLELESVGLERIDISGIQLNNSQMELEAENGVVRFELWPFSVRGVSIGRARIMLRESFTTVGSASAPATVPAPPPFHLRIDEFLLEAQTPSGLISIPASVESGPGAGGRFEAEIRSPEFLATLGSTSEDRHVLDVYDSSNSQLLSLNVDLANGFPFEFAGQLNTSETVRWAGTRAPLPSGLKSAIAPLSVEGGRVQFNGTMRENLDLSVSLRGQLLVRDGRDPASRLFDEVEIRAESGYEITRSDTSWSGSGDATFRLAPDAGMTLTGSDPAWRWDTNGFRLTASKPTLVELGFDAETMNINTSGSIDASAMDGNLEIGGLRMSGWPQGMAFYDVKGNWAWQAPAVGANGRGSGHGLPELDWKLDSGPGQGSVEIRSRHPVPALAPSLKNYTGALARETTIKNGELEGNYRLEWIGDNQNSTLAVTAGPLDANLDEMEIRGLRVNLSNRGNTLDELQVDITAPSLKLAAGTTAQDLEIRSRLAYPEIGIDKAQTRLFGGDIAIRPTTIDFDADQITLFADIDRLSLERIMALMELETTKLSGEVAGPVRMIYTRNQGLEINQGDLRSVQPGVLKFTMSGGSEATAQFNNIALQALENFQYDELKASVLYKPDGQYRISARILGSNPKVLDGHPIALNPTIEGRLPALFRAFFITGDFNRAIIERLRDDRSLSTSGETTTFQDE